MSYPPDPAGDSPHDLQRALEEEAEQAFLRALLSDFDVRLYSGPSGELLLELGCTRLKDISLEAIDVNKPRG